MFNKLFIILVLFLALTGAGLAKGPHTDSTIYIGVTARPLTGVCSACHVAHGAKDSRLWPVTVEDTSGVSVIQDLCMCCHFPNRKGAVFKKDGFYVDPVFNAHILAYAHGQNGPLYESGSSRRYGPGHLYRSNCTTRYEEPVIGYKGLGYNSFESIACYADPDTTGYDSLALPRLSCTSCHDPHAEYIVGKYKNRQGAHETYYGTADNYILDVVGDGETTSTTYYTTYTTADVIGRTRKICMACHGSSNKSSNIKIDGLTPLQPTSGVSAHDTASTSKCTDCHSWDWLPIRCGGCHGLPPSAISGAHNYASTSAFPAFTSVGVGAHDTHVKLEGYNSCEVCHYNYEHYNGTVDVRFNTDYVATKIIFPGGTKIRPTDTCIVTGSGESKKIECVVGCHEPKVGGIDNNTKVPWPTTAVSEEIVYTLVSCISCHDAVGAIFKSTVPNASAHPYVTASIISERNSCEICHRDHKWAKYDSSDKKWKAKEGRSQTHTRGFGSTEWDTAVLVGLSFSCYPCHDATPFDEAPFGKAPKAAAFFYGFYQGTIAGSGGHGQSITQVSGHKMELECRDCHRYHGSSIGKILYESAIRPSDVDTHKGQSSGQTATGNDNTFCYRCHFFKYDNGFYSKTAFGLSVHETTFCVGCHEPHGGYGWDTATVFDTFGFSSFTRAGTRGSYVDNGRYGTAVNLGDENLCFRCHNDISDYFNTTSGSRHRINKNEQDTGALGNSGYLIIECINCHNPHTVRKDTNHDSVVTNLMYPFRPAEFMSDTSVTDSTFEYKVYNKFCLECHDEGSETNVDSGMIYRDKDYDSLWGKLPRGIKFSNKTKWGEGGTAFHSWNKATYYNSTGHGIDSTLSIGGVAVGNFRGHNRGALSDRLPLARLGSYGLACGRIDEFACHDPHGNRTNVSLLKTNVKHPKDTDFAVPSKHNYNTPHIYDSTVEPADEPENTDRWCAAACHQIGKRADEKDWSHTFTYVRTNRSIKGRGAGAYSTVSYDIRRIDIYDTANGAGDSISEPILNNMIDMDKPNWVEDPSNAHSSYNRVPGDGNDWPCMSSKWQYNYVSYKNSLPVKSDYRGTCFVCFTCHDPHGTENSRYAAMIRASSEDFHTLCRKCHKGVGWEYWDSCFGDCHKFYKPPVSDSATLLLLHLDESYEGANKEQPVVATDLGYVTGRLNSGVSFGHYESPKLVYPLWTNKITGLPDQPGVQHDSATDLTIRFDTSFYGEGGKNPCATPKLFVPAQEYVVGNAVHLKTGDRLAYYSSAIPSFNVSSGSFGAWVHLDPGGGIRNTAENRYIFLHTTSSDTTETPLKNAIFLRHCTSMTWDAGVSNEAGAQSLLSRSSCTLSEVPMWIYIAMTWSDPNLTMYVSNEYEELISTTSVAQYFPEYTYDYFHVGNFFGNKTINTCIDEVQISNYAKTGAEILEDYNRRNEMNFDPRMGELQFWVKPYWDGNDGENHCFFENYYDSNNYFRLSKTKYDSLVFAINGNGVQSTASYAVTASDLGRDKWTYVVITWERENSKMKLFLSNNDGPVGRNDNAAAMKYVHIDTALYFGCRKYGTESVRAVMDEIWIKNRVLPDRKIPIMYRRSVPAHEDSIPPTFDTTWYMNDTAWIIDSNPADNCLDYNIDGIRTGTTSSIKFLTGVDPRYATDHCYDNDNIFRQGDRMTFYFRAVESSTSLKPEESLSLDRSGIDGDFSEIDANPDRDESFGGYRYYGNGLYSFYYTISDSTKSDTKYDTVSNMYDNLYRVKIRIKDVSGNAVEDTTYQCILDNTQPSWVE